MAQLSKDDVLHIAKLARLKLTGKEVEKFQTELSKILAYVEQLSEVDTEGVEPVSQITGLKMVTHRQAQGHPEPGRRVTRKDEVRPGEAKPADLLACSPLPIVDDHIQTLSAHG